MTAKKTQLKTVAAKVTRVSPPPVVADIEATRNRRQNLRPGIVRYFTERPGTPVYLADIAKAVGARDEKSVMGAIAVMIREKVMPIQVMTRGLVWIYRPNGAVVEAAPVSAMPVSAPATARELYELIGESRDGTKVLRGEDGTLWKATEL